MSALLWHASAGLSLVRSPGTSMRRKLRDTEVVEDLSDDAIWAVAFPKPTIFTPGRGGSQAAVRARRR